MTDKLYASPTVRALVNRITELGLAELILVEHAVSLALKRRKASARLEAISIVQGIVG